MEKVENERGRRVRVMVVKGIEKRRRENDGVVGVTVTVLKCTPFR